MVHKIIQWPDDKVLRTPCAEVTEFNDSLRLRVKSMFETLYGNNKSNGVALAANQIGFSQQITVIDTRPWEEDGVKLVLINPRIVFEDQFKAMNEGCLSIPGGHCEMVVRPTVLTVLAQDEFGLPQEINATGLLARAISHEVDHLKGILFIDHITSLRRTLLITKMQNTIKKLNRVPIHHHSHAIAR